jgi:hypothetical protein
VKFLAARKPAFVYPIPPAPRTAVLIPGFRSRGKVRLFADGWSAKAARFKPQAIAGTLAQFEAIAATDISVSHAIIVIGRCDDARLTEADREKLWTRFRVPVFEQIVGEDRKLLAAECEAHFGLHVVGKMPPDVVGKLDTSPCGCLRTTPRIISEEPREHAAARAAGL